MRLRTSRWILRLLLLPFLLLVIGSMVLGGLNIFTRYDSLVSLLMLGVAVAIPGVIIYAIWKGHKDSARISDRRRRRRQASRKRAHFGNEPENPFDESADADQSEDADFPFESDED